MDIFKSISSSTIERYSERLNKLGGDVRALGWGSEEQQRYRFAQILRMVDLRGKSLLDIGCGFGDLKGFCDDRKSDLAYYIGWDVNSKLLDVAKKRYPSCDFFVFDLLNESEISSAAQVGVMLGLLNYNLTDKYDNVNYSKHMIRQAFNSVEETLVVDFLSSEVSSEYPREDFVYYHDPAEMLSFALSLTSNARLFHDYAPIPQKEFMLVLEHV